MSLILTILGIIAAIPGTIDAFKRFMEWIKGLRGAEREEAEKELAVITEKYKGCKGKEAEAACAVEVEGLMERLKARRAARALPQGE